MNTTLKRLALSALLVVPLPAFWRYKQYPLPNPPAQKQHARCTAFFAARPSATQSENFLNQQRVNYQKSLNADVFVGNTSTNFQNLNRRKIGSEIVFGITDTEIPFCGKTDALFEVSFDKRGRLLKAEEREANWGCLDF